MRSIFNFTVPVALLTLASTLLLATLVFVDGTALRLGLGLRLAGLAGNRRN